jgi:hypothetical protein
MLELALMWLPNRNETPHRQNQRKTEIKFLGESLRDSPRRDVV